MSEETFDRIIISELPLHTCIGHTTEERAFPQRLVISIELFTEAGTTTNSNQLENTICWEAVKEQVVALSQGNAWVLVEELAESTAQLLLESYPALEGTKVLIKKFALPGVGFTAIEITRWRQS